jgi:hypothetical protein
MKNLAIAVLTAVLSMSCLSCSGQKGNTSKDNNVTKQETKVKTIHLTKADFLSKVANSRIRTSVEIKQ